MTVEEAGLPRGKAEITMVFETLLGAQDFLLISENYMPSLPVFKLSGIASPYLKKT